MWHSYIDVWRYANDIWLLICSQWCKKQLEHLLNMTPLNIWSELSCLNVSHCGLFPAENKVKYYCVISCVISLHWQIWWLDDRWDVTNYHMPSWTGHVPLVTYACNWRFEFINQWFIFVRLYGINLLWPCDAKLCHRSWLILVQVMTWCHQAHSHYLNQLLNYLQWDLQKMCK